VSFWSKTTTVWFNIGQQGVETVLTSSHFVFVNFEQWLLYHCLFLAGDMTRVDASFTHVFFCFQVLACCYRVRRTV